MADYKSDPAVHIFADTEAAMARMRRTAREAGYRVLSVSPIRQDLDPSGIAVPGAVILIELESEAGEEVAALLDWLRQEAEQYGRRAVVSAPLGLIDLVAASADHAGIVMLCEADEAERIAAVTRAGAPNMSKVRDGGTGARVLQRPPVYAPDPAGPDDLHLVRAIVRARRLREEHFPDDLFADPAWDILLDLMAARLERKPVTVSSLCVAAAVPPTTALRWISVLTERGLLVRVADSADRRRVYVELSEATARGLLGWLRQARRLTAEAL